MKINKVIKKDEIQDQIDDISIDTAKKHIKFYTNIINEPDAFTGSIRIQDAIVHLEILHAKVGSKFKYDLPSEKPKV